MDQAEALAFLEASHTGVLATLRADGSPALSPLWFVVVDGAVIVRTLAASAKVRHIRRDPRVSFLVESGLAWQELQATILYGTAEVIGDRDLIARIDEAFAAKYDAFTIPARAPERTREHYAAERVHIRIVPDRRSLTWDNAKLMRSAPVREP